MEVTMAGPRRLNHSKNHPGFAAVAGDIAAKEGVSSDSAKAILASSTRKAGVKARRINPRLNKVKMEV